MSLRLCVFASSVTIIPSCRKRFLIVSLIKGGSERSETGIENLGGGFFLESNWMLGDIPTGIAARMTQRVKIVEKIERNYILNSNSFNQATCLFLSFPTLQITVHAT